MTEVNKHNKELNDWIDKIISELNKAQDDVAKVIMDKGKDTAMDITFTPGENRKKSEVSRDVKAHTDRDGETSDSVGKNNSAQNAQQILRAAQTIATNEQDVITMNVSIHLDAVKFAIAQARKVWTAAAAWSSGVHKEGYEYINALSECAEEEFYSNMENI